MDGKRVNQDLLLWTAVNGGNFRVGDNEGVSDDNAFIGSNNSRHRPRLSHSQTDTTIRSYRARGAGHRDDVVSRRGTRR